MRRLSIAATVLVAGVCHPADAQRLDPVFGNERTVTTHEIVADDAVLNGAPTFITFVEQARRPHEVRPSKR